MRRNQKWGDMVVDQEAEEAAEAAVQEVPVVLVAVDPEQERQPDRL